MAVTAINWAGLFTVISNLALLIPFVTAVKWRRILRAFVLFVETFVSAFYHIADFSSYSIFPFSTLHHLDFFFAQLIMVLALLYIVHFNDRWQWLEWVLIFTSAFVLVILQITLPGELYVQAGIAVFFFVFIMIYWFIYAKTVGNGSLPQYDWSSLTLGLSLMAGSSVLYSAQLIWPQGYWLSHSFWHIAAAIGFNYILQIKRPAKPFSNAAMKIARVAGDF